MQATQILSVVVIGGVLFYIYKNKSHSKGKLPKLDKIRPHQIKNDVDPTKPPPNFPFAHERKRQQPFRSLIKTKHFT